MLKTILFLTIVLSFNCFSYEKQFVILSILTDENINVQRLDSNISVKFGDVLAIYSHESNLVLGYATVLTSSENSDLFIAKVQTHDKNGIIRIENYLKKIDLNSASTDIPARFDLIVNTEQKVAAKYRSLVYTGIANGMTAANLIKGEYLIGPSIFAYGLNSGHQVSSNLISNMFKILNIGLKSKIYDYDDVTLTIENSFQYFHAKKRGSYLFTGYLDTTSNSSFKSYAKVKIFTHKPEDQYLYNNEEYKNDINVELQLSYGYMMNNWRQFIFGPKIDVNKKRVGGFLGYYVVEKEVNMMLGLSSSDFSEFRIGKQAYLLNFDLWWRF